jgi:signal transduction histidine kinase
MEAMGKFAGGVAHDFNNVIQVVKGFSELIMMKVDRDSEISEEIEEIGKAAKRAMDITNQLLLFSRRKPANINDVDMNSLISNLNNMLIGALGENISLETVLDPALKPAKADMDLIRQVLLNLAVNAKDSMPDGGKLKIMTRNICFEEPGGASMNEAASGDFVLISVSDTGQGMTPEAKTHVFEPFFSTKPRSKGAGLGLSAVYGIVKQHNGWINVSSEPGLGTSFEIYLPALAI